jgi:hypothetical protein
MTNNPPPLLSPVKQRLLEARAAACDEMHRLIDERGDGEFSAAATRQFFYLTRRVASIDAARHDGDFSALTGDEIAWLQSQGVQIENRIKSDLARLDRMTDEDIDYSDIPPLDDEFFKNAKAVSPPEKPAPQEGPPKADET